MDAAQREYDRFGPWAVRISDEDPPPPLFASYLKRAERPLLSVKIPRHLERRNARPGMDLYDYLVALYEDDLVILQREGREVRIDGCRYRDVQYLRVSRSLLRGNIHLGLPGRPHDLGYNTVSDGLMLRLVEIIRQRYAREPAALPAWPEPRLEEGVLSFYFERLLAAERRGGRGMRLLAAQGTVPLASHELSAVRRLLFRVVDKRLLEGMHFADGRELMTLTRGKAFAYRWEVEYGIETTWLPLRNITAVEVRPDPSNAAASLILRTAAGDCPFAFADTNDTLAPYEAWLAGLPGVSHSVALPPTPPDVGVPWSPSSASTSRTS
jgi:hypothetical protein